MKEISFSSFHFGKTGQREVGVAGVVCGDRFGACICSGKGRERWVGAPGEGWGGDGEGSRWHTVAPKVVRPVRAELTAGFSVCKKASRVRRLPRVPHAYGLISHPRQVFWENLFFLERKADKNNTQVLSSNAEKIDYSLLQTCACLMLGEALLHRSL